MKEAETSPTTGIKINIDGQGNYYEEQSIFEFVLELESNNAYLSDIVLSTGEVDEENPENSTYKEYDLTPEFDKGTFTYNVEILEYIDKMNLKITKDYEKSTIIMKVPKRDENDNLMYEDDGTTIVYQEYEITDSNNLTQEVLTEFVLNKLGEPDTIIELKVMAEDGYTTNTYQIIIKRPYGTIKGTIQYDMIEQNENPDIDKTTDLNFYKTGRFNWNELKDIFGQIYENPATYDDLDELDKDLYMTSNADGTYEIYLIPGSYDLQIDKRGFLDFIITNIEVTDGAVINLGNRILTAGDVNRDRSNRIGRYSRSCGTYGCYYRRC